MLCKALYLEWYSRRNGRVVIQDTRLAVERISERAFALTEEQWAEQAKQNQEEMSFFMYQLDDVLFSMNGLDEEDFEPDEGNERR